MLFIIMLGSVHMLLNIFFLAKKEMHILVQFFFGVDYSHINFEYVLESCTLDRTKGGPPNIQSNASNILS